MNKFYKDKINNILENSREENLKYLENVLKIKDISEFNAILMMSQLRLNPDMINLINMAIEKFKKTSQNTSYDDFFYRLITNIKILDYNLSLKKQDRDSSDYKTYFNLIFDKSIYTSELKSDETPTFHIKFSKVY